MQTETKMGRPPSPPPTQQEIAVDVGALGEYGSLLDRGKATDEDLERVSLLARRVIRKARRIRGLSA